MFNKSCLDKAEINDIIEFHPQKMYSTDAESLYLRVTGFARMVEGTYDSHNTNRYPICCFDDSLYLYKIMYWGTSIIHSADRATYQKYKYCAFLKEGRCNNLLRIHKASRHQVPEHILEAVRL